jgi:hypothetical protein
MREVAEGFDVANSLRTNRATGFPMTLLYLICPTDALSAFSQIDLRQLTPGFSDKLTVKGDVRRGRPSVAAIGSRSKHCSRVLNPNNTSYFESPRSQANHLQHFHTLELFQT